jgi:8-oxo-dGTP diphosphatase
MSESRRKARVVAALIPDPHGPGRFLVQRRLPGKSRALQWEFPGGKVEPHETDVQALARECGEELDVKVHVGGRLWGTVHDYADLRVELVVYAARIMEGEPKPLGASAVGYFTPEDMRALSFCEADLPLVEELASGKVPGVGT